MEDKSETILKSDIVRAKALEVVKEVLENSIEDIVLERKVSPSPCLASICEETPEEPVETPEEPVETPEELDLINLEMEEASVEISVDCDNEKTHTEIVGEKYCCSLWRW